MIAKLPAVICILTLLTELNVSAANTQCCKAVDSRPDFTTTGECRGSGSCCSYNTQCHSQACSIETWTCLTTDQAASNSEQLVNWDIVFYNTDSYGAQKC